MVIALLTVAGFVVGVASLADALRLRQPRRHGWIRWTCLLLTGALLCAGGGPAHAEDLLVLLRLLGFLASFLAVGLAPDAPREESDEPRWWPEFEREFRAHVRALSEGREA